MKKQFKLIIEIDETKLKEKYPNFEINYKNTDDFITSILDDLHTDLKKEYGYKITIK